MSGPSDAPFIDNSTQYLRRDWSRLMSLPHVLEVDDCNRSAKSAAPYVSGWLQTDAPKGFDGYSVDFKADYLPEGTFCCACGFDLDYSAQVGPYGPFSSIRKHAGICGIAGLERHNNGRTGAVLTLWNVLCAAHTGGIQVVRPRRLYPTRAGVGSADESEYVRFEIDYAWRPERWYRMHLCCKRANTGHATIEQWICDLETGDWTLLCIFDLGLPGIYFVNNTALYLENTEPYRAGDVRTLEYKNAYIHDGQGGWRQLTEAVFTQNYDYQGSYCFGSDGSLFYMATTGVLGKTPRLQPAQRFAVQANRPNRTVGNGAGSAGQTRTATDSGTKQQQRTDNSNTEKKNPSCLTTILVLVGLFLFVRWLVTPSKAEKTAASTRATAAATVRPRAAATRRPTATRRSAATAKPQAMITRQPIYTLAPRPTAVPTPVETYDWDLFSELGSAYTLNGRNVIVSIYLSDASYSWRWDVNKGRDNATAYNHLKYLGIACGWLTDQAKKYGAEPGFFYDWSKHSDLYYELTLPYNAVDPTSSFVGAFTQAAYSDMLAFIHKSIDCDGLLRKYSAGNIIFLFFVNNPRGGTELRSHANYVRRMNHPLYPYEYCVLYNYQAYNALFPATMAHELLHCYGAQDLYESRDGVITPEYVDYLKRVRSKDIMYTTFDPRSGRAYYDRIIQELTELDAYYIGLTNYSGEANLWSLGVSDFAS